MTECTLSYGIAFAWAAVVFALGFAIGALYAMWCAELWD
jgi:hypothetical protein